MKSISKAHRQAAITASRTAAVRRAARELATKIDDGGINTDAEAHELLDVAVSRTLAASAPEAPKIVHDFAAQAALFAVGAHFFIVPPGTKLTEWVASMPDEALDGMRNAMIETSRALGQNSIADNIANLPNEVFAETLAESAPKAASHFFIDLNTAAAVADECESLDPLGEVSRILIANAANTELRNIGLLVQRHAGLARRLRKFNFPEMAALLSGLLVRPENQTATARVEALVHLSALACKGKKRPGLKQLHTLLTQINEDPVAKLEIPVEDVFVSNVTASFGNARLFQGRWVNNAEHVNACIDTLFRVGKERHWAREALRHIMALLRVSEALADRIGVRRYDRTQSMPREKIALRASAVREKSRMVTFRDKDLAVIGVRPEALDPFLINKEHSGSLVRQAIGHSVLERRPLVRFNSRTTVALPTAIGAAIWRFAVEQATVARELHLFQSTYHRSQFTDVFMLGRLDWGIGYIEMPEPDPDDGMREFIGTFDEGSYVHLVFVPDEFDDVAETGLANARPLEEPVIVRMRKRATLLASRQGYRRGLTIVVNGGPGRRFSSDVEDLSGFPGNWHQLCVSASDFILLGNSPDVTAQRTWKLLHTIDDLKASGINFLNFRGFTNLIAFACAVDFDLAPENPSLEAIYLNSDLLLPMRHDVRSKLDHHAARAHDGVSWVDVQRRSADKRFDQIRAQKEYFSPKHHSQGLFLACIKSDLRPWWVHSFDGIPEEQWPRDVALNLLEAALGWLDRLVPEFEERYPMLPSGPVTLQFRFPNIETFNQHDLDPERTTKTPRVSVAERQVVIECDPNYLQSFLMPGNLGDRLLITAMVRGLERLCGNEPLPDVVVKNWLRSVVGTDNDRFFKMREVSTPEDLVYDIAKLPELRLPMPEDLAESRRGLARLAGYAGEPGPIPSSRAVNLLNFAVEAVWQRVKERLANLSRESTIDLALLNYVAACKEHRDWMLAMESRLAVYDGDLVIDASTERVSQRDIASIASRVIAEMSLCASPCDSGALCTKTDLDFLIAEIQTLLACASQSDALHFGLADQPPSMRPNGSFEFDASATQAWASMMEEHWRREFRDAAELRQEGNGTLNPEFWRAFNGEFGLAPEQLAEFINQAAFEVVGDGKALLKLRRSEVVRRLREVGAVDGQRTFEALVLCPRDRWDENPPANARARDWYPWRFNRRLSVLRRPLIQISQEKDPIVVLAPSLLANSLGYITMAEIGGRPETLFDSPEMISFVGKAAARSGHDFARKVESRLRVLNWNTAREVGLTQFGGEAPLGDVDVLCWRPSSGAVYVIECKSLRFDKTLGETGERLAEYAAGNVSGKRTPLQKHLDRMAFFKANRETLADFTSIAGPRLRLRSALVTEHLGSLQFGGEARKKLDVVTDYERLKDCLTD